MFMVMDKAFNALQVSPPHPPMSAAFTYVP